MTLTKKINLIQFITTIHSLSSIREIITKKNIKKLITIIAENKKQCIAAIIPFLVFFENKKNTENNIKTLTYLLTRPFLMNFLHKIRKQNLPLKYIYETLTNLQEHIEVLYNYLIHVQHNKTDIKIFILQHIMLKDVTLNPIKKIKHTINFFLKKPTWRQMLDIIMVIAIYTLPLPLKKITAIHVILSH